MYFTLAIILLLAISYHMRKVGVDWLFKRKDVGIFLLLFSRGFWWLLVFMLVTEWFRINEWYFLIFIFLWVGLRTYQEKDIYFTKRKMSA